MENYYEILNIPKNADAEKIKSSFRSLAKKYHPDRNPGDKLAEEKFKKINEAYSVLSDPEKRKRYDLGGFNDFSEYRGAYYGRSGQEAQGDDPFSTIFDEEFFKNMFGSDSSYSNWRWDTSKGKKKDPPPTISRMDAIKSLIRGIFLIILGLISLKILFIIGFIGVLISFYLISTGFKHAKLGYEVLFKSS